MFICDSAPPASTAAAPAVPGATASTNPPVRWSRRPTVASNTEMRRLILHAADRLGEEDIAPMVAPALAFVGHDREPQVIALATSVTAAMALAEQTLRMVAACLADDEPDQAALEAGHG